MKKSTIPDVFLRDVNFSYNRTLVLENINLKISPKESICLVGPNGGGKTTLLKLVLGLLSPDRGEILIFGKMPKYARSNIGYVPQYVHYDPQFPVTVKDVVIMGRIGHHLGGPYSKKDKQAAQKALEELEINELSNQLFEALSGGQRQRVLIARALSSEPKLLLLDEPTANVDPQFKTKLIDLLQEFNQRLTIMMVTHDTGFVSSIFKSVYCVNRKMVAHSTCDIESPILKDVYGKDLRLVQHDDSCTALVPQK